MSSIHHEIEIDTDPAAVWDAVRDIGALHTRVVPGFVANTEIIATTPSPIRRVTFVSGFVADEVIVDCDDDRRRLAWTITAVEHHNGVMQVHDVAGRARVTWTADVLPAEMAAQFSPAMANGLMIMKAHFERDVG